MILFTTYYQSNNALRQAEIDASLKNNIQNSLISKIFIFLDSNTTSDIVSSKFNSNKLKYIQLNSIPMYSDWIKYSKNLNSEEVSLFANADIYFDESLINIKKYLGEKRIICLSRHNLINQNLILQNQPEWSQDFWAIKVSEIEKIYFEKELEIQTAIPGCDNKLAFVFTMAGWDLFNPFNEVKCIHLHSSEIRNYDKFDHRIAGTLANVHESKSPSNPSMITINIMPLKSSNIKDIGINIWLEESNKNLK